MSALDSIPRKRDRLLAQSLIKHVAEAGGELTEEVAAAALRETWHKSNPYGPKIAMEIIQRKLRNPNIRAALGGIYAELADYTIADAVQKHVEHIEGIEHDVVTKRGDVVRVKEKPSYPALKDFLGMTLPMPAKQLQVGMTVAGVAASMLTNVPPIEARALGPAVVSDVPDAQTVEFTEAEDDE